MNEPMNDIQEANYIKLNGQVFSITPIANSGVDIEAELKQFYNDKYARHVDMFNRGIVEGMSEDWTAQMDKLRERADRDSVVIPPNLIGKYVLCHDGCTVEEVRAVIYSPNLFKMVRSDLAQALNITHTSEERSSPTRRVRVYGEGHKIKIGSTEFDLNTIDDAQVLLVKVKQRIFFPAMYSFNAQSNMLRCFNVNTFHNQRDSICTGNHKASEFWNSPNFEELMNQVNCFSLGSRQVHLKQDTARSFGIPDFVKRSTITEIQLEGAGTWRT